MTLDAGQLVAPRYGTAVLWNETCHAVVDAGTPMFVVEGRGERRRFLDGRTLVAYRVLAAGLEGSWFVPVDSVRPA